MNLKTTRHPPLTEVWFWSRVSAKEGSGKRRSLLILDPVWNQTRTKIFQVKYFAITSDTEKYLGYTENTFLLWVCLILLIGSDPTDCDRLKCLFTLYDDSLNFINLWNCLVLLFNDVLVLTANAITFTFMGFFNHIFWTWCVTTIFREWKGCLQWVYVYIITWEWD